ncbi:hypothetical protein J3R82DRAFT_3575 [Butyriboletus roseoflavus]|nr:hypothetical protein J3R82DRAFT_3575 [Butyriboletus roseoflavus]
MSSNSTTTGSVSSTSLNGIIHPALNSLMIGHTFLTLLIPLVVSLFYFSTSQSRHRPLFILNIAAIFLAFVQGVLIDGFAVHTVLEPLNPWPLAFNIIIGFISVSQSIVIDLALLVRLISVYPLIHVGPVRFVLIIAIPVLLKLTRVINIFLFTKVMVDAMNGPNAAVTMGVAYATKPYLKIEWAAQMIDNTYASLAFLSKISHQVNQRVLTGASRSTLAERMRTLFRIALTNFLVPTMFSIAQFVCVYRNVDPMILNQLVLVNTMVATFGVAFATVWAGKTRRQEEQILESTRNNTTSRLMAIFGLGIGRGVNASDDSGYTANSPEETKA